LLDGRDESLAPFLAWNHKNVLSSCLSLVE
jgi:hypothetical protein